MRSKGQQRQHNQYKKDDKREEFQIDRDRLIYSFAFRRLAQVTQVASSQSSLI
jgi:dGTPase